jgi:hypothetical protein
MYRKYDLSIKIIILTVLKNNNIKGENAIEILKEIIKDLE